MKIQIVKMHKQLNLNVMCSRFCILYMFHVVYSVLAGGLQGSPAKRSLHIIINTNIVKLNTNKVGWNLCFPI